MCSVVQTIYVRGTNYRYIYYIYARQPKIGEFRSWSVHAGPFKPQSNVKIWTFCQFVAINERWMAPTTTRIFQNDPCDNPQRALHWGGQDLIAVSIHDDYSIGPSIRPICARFCFTMTNMILVCSNFLWARIFFLNSHPDEIATRRSLLTAFATLYQKRLHKYSSSLSMYYSCPAWYKKRALKKSFGNQDERFGENKKMDSDIYVHVCI